MDGITKPSASPPNLPPPQRPKVPPSVPPSPIDISLPPTRSEPPRKKPRRLLWILLAGTGIFIVLVIIVSLAAVSWYADALRAKSGDDTSVKIDIQQGATIDEVAQELSQKGIIKSSLAFSVYVKLNNKAGIKTGTYFFAPNQSVSEIVQWLDDGRVGTRKVTILPGKTLTEIKQTLITDGFNASDVDAAFSKSYNHPLLAEKPANATLEGYIYPETYFVTTDSTVEQLLTRSFDEFEKQIQTNDIRTKLAAHGFNLYQGVTLASIVAREVSNPTDQRQVAQVFETRLSRGMVLGSDVTYHYAADLLGVAPSPDIDSPYNTHKYPGLPPGPIGNFNLPALLAIADPAPGDYIYFVAGDDGTTHFATTFEEHQQNIQKYCQKLCTSP